MTSAVGGFDFTAPSILTPSDPRASRDPWLWLSLLLGLAVRLVGLDEPLIDHQAWRQTETAAIARNFLEEGYDILHPRVDWRGTTEGYVEMNFPLYPFLVACVYGVLGYPAEWVGRLLAALFSTATAGVVYQLARRLYADRIWVARLAAALFLFTPMSLFFGRAFMTETLMLFLSAGTLLAFLHWLERPGYRAFGVAAATAALCFAVKIPTLYLGFPLVGLAWWKWGAAMLRKPLLWVFLILSLAPSVWWYWHAAGLFEETGLTFGIWNRYGYDKWATADLLLSADFHALMAARLAHRALTPIGLGLAIWGLVLGRPRSSDRPGEEGETSGRSLQWMPFIWLGGILLYVILVPEGNRRLHYYQLPLVPVGALFAALPLAQLIETRAIPGGRRDLPADQVGGPPRGPGTLIAALLLASICAYSGWSVIDYYRPANNVYEYYRSCWEAGARLDAKLPPDALLVIGDYDENAGTPYRAQSPTLLYYCHRKGWQITLDEISDERLSRFSKLGADYFVAATGLIGGDAETWRALQSRGLSYPSAYPRMWQSAARFFQASRADQGADRHLVVVPLGQVPDLEDNCCKY